ncbi:MAG: long-chain-fatty-acid--CoA ligase [Streptosporangiales bacterium]|nr:long-chain-fatty-acid--CoA ligase [Streptosporangiales bacterium]
MYITQGLHRSLQQHPDALAVRGPSGDRTFAELAGRVARLASALAALGLRPGDRVGIITANSPEFVETFLACCWGGFTAAPVNTRWSLAEMAYQMNDADISVLVADPDHLPRARELREACPVLRRLIATGPQADGFGDYEKFLAGSGPAPDVRASGDALVAILYTGGTTGEPKGVMISAGQLITSATGTLATAGTPQAHRFLHTSPLYHLASLAGVVQQVILGSSHFILGDFETEAVATAIERERITSTTLVPVMIQRLVAHARRTGADLSSLRLIGYGASPISESVLKDTLDLLPGVDLCQRYGMTELGPVATVLTPGDHRDAGHPHLLRSVGRAALHAEIRVVDPGDRDVPAGEVGEIIVRGGNMMLGYWKKPEATKEALRGGWMHTGDLGYVDSDGYVYVVDRLKDMIVSGGENVYSAEVEQVLGRHPDVDACAVIGVPDPEWGERVHAVVVPSRGAELTGEEIREFCARSIARYKAPRTVDFAEELPRSAVGKILKRTLRERYRG